MSDSEISRLFELAVLTPTSYNIQNWRFVYTTDQHLKDTLSKMSYGQRQVSESSVVIILVADLCSWDKNPQRYWASLSESDQSNIIKEIRESYRNKPQQQQHDEAMRSCGMAAQTIMLASRSMGYDTCPMTGFDYDLVGKLINLPKDHVICMMIVVGKKIREPYPRGGQVPLSEIVFVDKF